MWLNDSSPSATALRALSQSSPLVAASRFQRRPVASGRLSAPQAASMGNRL